MAKKINILVGSLRRASFARSVALCAAEMLSRRLGKRKSSKSAICKFTISTMTTLPWNKCRCPKATRLSA